MSAAKTERNAEIVARYQRGDPQPAIAAALGVPLTIVKKQVKRHRARHALPLRIDPVGAEELAERVVAAFRDGATYGQIAWRCRTNEKTVSSIIHRARARGEDLPRRENPIRTEPLSMDTLTQRDRNLVGWWHEGKSQGQIAVLMGCTVNAVAGRVARLRRAGVEIPPRPEVFNNRARKPRVQADGEAAPRVRRRRAQPPRQLVAPVAAPAAAPVVAEPKPAAPMQRLGHWAFDDRRADPAPPPVARLPRRPPPTSYHKTCQMIFGETRLPDGTAAPMCARPSLPGKSWCEDCCARVFRRVGVDVAA